MSKSYPNEFWNDSCRVDELQHAVSLGAVGATSNPPLMWKAIQADDRSRW
ncbi:MAG: transaldolase, partial [Planctomycetes bacterium]|nr:transaldolase [Planctomycetota bacterium]